MVRSVGAVGTFVLGLHKKREKVPHPGLQHVNFKLKLIREMSLSMFRFVLASVTLSVLRRGLIRAFSNL